MASRYIDICGSLLFSTLFLISLLATPTKAAEEIFINVFSGGLPVSDALIAIDGATAGRTGDDGTLLIDGKSAGRHTLGVETGNGRIISQFTSGAGQRVDVIVQADKNEALIDIYSPVENVGDRKTATLGTLKIRVTRAGNPVEREPVYIAGIGKSLQTNSAGEVTVTIPRGEYRTQVAEQISKLRVVGGLTRIVDLKINEVEPLIQIAQPQIEEVVVMASFDPAGLEVSERDTANIVDVIGVEQLARFADSDVAASVVRVPGISVQDNKYVFIRGLGGRYVSATLNQATMPSTNPSKRTVPLDLFPSNFVSQLDIKKTFLTSMPGESTGGNLVINTKAFPDERIREMTLQGGYTDGLTGETIFTDPIQGGLDSLGLDDGGRGENPALSVISDFLRLGEAIDSQTGQAFMLDESTAGELRRAGALLIKDGFDPRFESAAPNAKFGVNFGDLFLLDQSDLGIYAAMNYSNEWSKREDGERYTYESEGEIADHILYRQYTNTVQLNGFVSVGWNIGDSTFEWNTVLSRVTESQSERSVGEEGDEFQAILRQTIQWEERQYLSTQLAGTHLVNDEATVFLEWQATLSQADRYAPDRREFDFTAASSATDPAALRAQYDFQTPNDQQANLFTGFVLEPGTILRRYDELIDDNIDFSGQLTWDLFDNGTSFSKLVGGMQLIARKRDSDSRIYGFNVNQVRDDLLRTENLLVSDVIYSCEAQFERSGCEPEVTGGIASDPNRGLVFVDKTLPSDRYDADLSYNSGFLMYDHTFDHSWQLVGGGRYESYKQTTDTFSLQGEQGAVQSVISEDSLLPSLGVNWFVSDTHQLRFAVSKTVARPDFKEAANATFYDNEFNFRVRGNPFLEVSDILNADLRWEWYLSEMDSLSIALFYKDMDKPIERVVQAASGTAGNSRTFQNADEAQLYGLEVDGRFEFMLGDSYDQTLFITFNAAFIESKVTARRQARRSLQGQPAYTANLILGYDSLSTGHQITVLLNQNGESIADVGVSGQPDVYMEPRLDLNVVYRLDVSDALTFKAKLDNMLDDKVRYTQGGQIFQMYNRGPTVQFGLDWQF